VDILFWVTISLIRFFLSFLSSGSKFMTISSASCCYLHLFSSRSRSLCLGCRWVFCRCFHPLVALPNVFFSYGASKATQLNWDVSSVALHGLYNTNELNWTGLDWTGLDWTGLDWTALNWTELNWTGLQYVDAVLLISFQFISRSSVQFSLFH